MDLVDVGLGLGLAGGTTAGGTTAGGSFFWNGASCFNVASTRKA